MKTFDEWAVIYEDNELISGRNPEDPEEYGINIKNTENYLVLPRGCLKDIALTDRNRGRMMIERLIPYAIGNFFRNSKSKNSRLNYDSLIAAIDKTYIKENERMQRILNQEF